MRLATDVVNDLVNDLGMRVSGGSIEIYGGKQPASPAVDLAVFALLVTVPLDTPAFEPAVDGRATGVVRENPVLVEQTGDATWARLKDPTGKTIADLTVRPMTDPEDADLKIDRIDLHRGGPFYTGGMVLRLPLVNE